MRIVFVGPPGAGKGTQSARLVDYLSIPHISSGDMLRAEIEAGSETGKQVEQFLSAGKLVPDQLMVSLVAARLIQPDCASGYLLDGFPRTAPQAEALDEILTAAGRAVDIVLEMKVPESILVERVLSRAAQSDSPRSDDNEATVHDRFETYRNSTEPILGYYRKRGICHEIEGVGTMEEVTERIHRVVDKYRLKSG